jgi:hypothetical protein
MNIFKDIFLKMMILMLCAVVLTMALRGNIANPTQFDLNRNQWKDDGPFELSPERGRFGLIYSIVEQGSVKFSPEVARFMTPDLGFKDGEYVSLFAPGVSLVALPGYLLGRMFDASQLGTYAVISVFALFNFLLIVKISGSLGASKPASYFAAIIFLFATPAFAYSVSLYQHHISTFVILTSFYLLYKGGGFRELFLVWFLLAFSYTVDYPNFIMTLPLAVWALSKAVIIKRGSSGAGVTIFPTRLLAVFAVLIPLTALALFNYYSYDNPFQLSGTVARVIDFNEEGDPVFPGELTQEELSQATTNLPALGFFETRNIYNGINVLLTGTERGILFYTPVIILGLLGFKYLFRKNKPASVILTIAGLNFLLYSMWGDPWGGWAFGARYLIPTYALMAIPLALYLDKAKKGVLIVVFVLFVYSMAVNLLGALTTNRIPPREEARYLETITRIYEPYTYERNLQMLRGGASKSFVYNNFFSEHITAGEYFFLLSLLVAVPAYLIFIWLVNINRKKGVLKSGKVDVSSKTLKRVNKSSGQRSLKIDPVINTKGE